MSPTDQVDDAEFLYRNIRAEYCLAVNPPKINPEGFFDSERKPSVDRANLCNNDPQHTRRGHDAVAVLVACEVRKIDTVKLEEPERKFDVDVIPDPVTGDAQLPDNPAHAKIVWEPWRDHKTLFRRLRHSLARLAERRPLAIPPSS